MKLAPSKHPEKESKQFSITALVFGILSLFSWIFAAGALAAGGRGLILSRRVHYRKGAIFSIIALVLGVISMGWYLAQPK